MNLYSRIISLLATPQGSAAELEAFLRELRDSIAASGKQFIAYPALIVAALTTYYFSTRLGSAVTVNGIQLGDPTLIRRVFLVVPSALLTAFASVGYLRRMQRTVYEYVTLARNPGLHKSGFYLLRLPSDYIAGLYLLNTEGGGLGKLISIVVVVLTAWAFFLGPIAFILDESFENISYFGFNDLVCLTASSISVLLCFCAIVILQLSNQFVVEAPNSDVIATDRDG